VALQVWVVLPLQRLLVGVHSPEHCIAPSRQTKAQGMPAAHVPSPPQLWSWLPAPQRLSPGWHSPAQSPPPVQMPTQAVPFTHMPSAEQVCGVWSGPQRSLVGTHSPPHVLLAHTKGQVSMVR
jgi:hypothetical protein